MFCIRCGAELPDNAQFCPKCGQKTDGSVQNCSEPPAQQAQTGPVQQTPSTQQEKAAPAQQNVPTQQAQTPPVRQPAPTWQGTTGPVPGNPVPGGPVPPANQGPQFRQPGQQSPQFVPSAKKTPKWLIPVVAGGSVAVVAIVLALGVLIFRGFADRTSSAPVSSVAEVSDGPAVNMDGWSHYENGAVCFALDYPEGYSVTEPNENNVLISSGDDFRFSVEYTFSTVSNSFVYSAEDFAEQIDNDPGVLREWVGAESVDVTGDSEISVGGTNGYLYEWSRTGGDGTYNGGTVFLESQDSVGCYALQWAILEGSELEEAYRDQAQAMLDSFAITGLCDSVGYDVFTADGLGFRFATRQGVLEEAVMELEDDELCMYPTGEKYADGRIQIKKNEVYSPDEDTAEEMLQGCASYFLKYKDQGRYISEIGALPMGRYEFTEVDLEYYENGKRIAVYEIAFPYDGDFWEIEMRAPEEELESVSSVLWEIVGSLCFSDGAGGASQNGGLSGGPSGNDVNAIVDEILRDVEEDVNSSGMFEPLVSFTDMDGNGVSELLILYEGDDYEVSFEVWTIKDGAASCVLEDELFLEVGGNSGSIGQAVDGAGNFYLVLRTKSPEGDQFNNVVRYIPWNSGQSGLSSKEIVLEGHGIYGEEGNGKYTVEGKAADYNAYMSRQEDFKAYGTDLDLFMGPGNGGNNMSFEHLRSFDLNTYTYVDPYLD